MKTTRICPHTVRMTGVLAGTFWSANLDPVTETPGGSGVGETRGTTTVVAVMCFPTQDYKQNIVESATLAAALPPHKSLDTQNEIYGWGFCSKDLSAVNPQCSKVLSPKTTTQVIVTGHQDLSASRRPGLSVHLYSNQLRSVWPRPKIQHVID